MTTWRTGRGAAMICALVLVALALVLVSCSDGGTGETPAEEPPDVSPVSEDTGQEADEPAQDEASQTSIDWYDYRYTFIDMWRDRDLNPTSEVVDYGGDYVHLRVRITKTADQRPDLKAPLQVLLECKGREYRMFGKDYTRYSYIWRDYTDFPDEVGESHVYIVTMELVPYSRALNTSFSVEEAELVLNGIDWTNPEQPQTVPLARVPLARLGKGGPPGR